MNPLANLSVLEIAEECGAILGYCEHCGLSVFEGDPPESRHRNHGTHEVFHARCMDRSLAPAGFWTTDDLAQHLFALGSDLSRAVLEQVRGGAA